MTQLFTAHRQWASRPDDERFASLEDLHREVSRHRAGATEARGVPVGNLYMNLDKANEPILVGANRHASLTHWAFGQLATKVGAPAGYLRELPGPLAAQNLNHGLRTLPDDATVEMLFHQSPGALALRAITSGSYARIWNADITARLLRLTQQDPTWQPAPAARDGSRGLYASDHDMFAFLVDNDRRVFERGPGGGLSRGFFVWNSEVGASSFGIMTFLYEYVCGNHIVWGAKEITELRTRHVGSAPERSVLMLAGTLRRYADASAIEDERRIERAQTITLGGTKEEVLDKVFSFRTGVSQKLIADAYDRAEQHTDWYGSPRTVWGMVNGITEIARDIPHADKRVEVERAAGRVMQVAF